MATRKRKVALFATEPVTGAIGGLGIRQLEAAREIHKNGMDVRLITPFPVGAHREKFRVEQMHFHHSPGLAREPMEWADVVYASQPSPIFLAMAVELGKPVAVDLLALVYFEELEHTPAGGMTAAQQAEYFARIIERNAHQLAMGDFFLCSNERERDYYLGMLTLLGKLKPEDYPNDRLFNSVIGVAPFGIPSREPKRGKNMMRGVIPGIRKNDFVVLWGGSLWNWYDCLTPVKAMALLLKKCPRVKLVFAGTKHPATSKPTEAFTEVYRYARRKGLLGKNVFFHSEWVPYNRHGQYLTEADIGLATFRDHIENRFSFRIRMTDYLWGNLPVLTNPGNTLSDLIEGKGLGMVLPFGDEKALAGAIARLAGDPAEMKRMRVRIAGAKKGLRWGAALKPLVSFCKSPRKGKTVFNETLAEMTFYDLNRKKPERVLFLRCSPMEHAEDALKALRSFAPNAAVDVVIQPGVDGSSLGRDCNFISLPGPLFSGESAGVVSGKQYDLVLCPFNCKDLTFYANVLAFIGKVQAKHYWAFNLNYKFVDIRNLLNETGNKTPDTVL